MIMIQNNHATEEKKKKGDKNMGGSRYGVE